jgi:hypothetical protein
MSILLHRGWREPRDPRILRGSAHEGRLLPRERRGINRAISVNLLHDGGDCPPASHAALATGSHAALATGSHAALATSRYGFTQDLVLRLGRSAFATNGIPHSCHCEERAGFVSDEAVYLDVIGDCFVALRPPRNDRDASFPPAHRAVCGGQTARCGCPDWAAALGYAQISP